MFCETHFRIKKNGDPDSRCYCRYPELIENYDKAIADATQTWEVHHRKEEFYSYAELIERGEYFDVQPEELIFLTHKEHCNIDSYCKRNSKAKKGKKHSDETNRKIGKANSKKVLCQETGEVFESTMDAYRKTGVYYSNISMACNGKYKTAGGYHWQFV